MKTVIQWRFAYKHPQQDAVWSRCYPDWNTAYDHYIDCMHKLRMKDVDITAMEWRGVFSLLEADRIMAGHPLYL
jgi:hypothetical protein